jgi:putative SOS response-associated peptidase YedK
MGSRYSLTSPPENIAPSQPVAIVRDRPKGGREMALVRCGLIPAWVTARLQEW